MAPSGLTPELVEAMEREVIDSLGRDAAEGERSVDTDQVSITMDARFRVTRVALRGTGVSGPELAALEGAVLSCVNDAISELTRRTAGRLAERFGDGAGPP